MKKAMIVLAVLFGVWVVAMLAAHAGAPEQRPIVIENIVQTVIDPETSKWEYVVGAGALLGVIGTLLGIWLNYRRKHK